MSEIALCLKFSYQMNTFPMTVTWVCASCLDPLKAKKDLRGIQVFPLRSGIQPILNFLKLELATNIKLVSLEVHRPSGKTFWEVYDSCEPYVKNLLAREWVPYV